MSMKSIERPSRGQIAAEIRAKELEAQLVAARASIVSLGRALFLAERRLANRDGYIERVSDVEQAEPKKNQVSVEGESVDHLRRLMAYSPDREAAAIIEAVSPDLLDAVLGKPTDYIDRRDPVL